MRRIVILDPWSTEAILDAEALLEESRESLRRSMALEAWLRARL